MRAFIEAGVDASKIECLGYSDKRYLSPPKIIPKDLDKKENPPLALNLSGTEASEQESTAPATQGAYFYMFVKNMEKLESMDNK